MFKRLWKAQQNWLEYDEVQELIEATPADTPDEEILNIRAKIIKRRKDRKDG